MKCVPCAVLGALAVILLAAIIYSALPPQEGVMSYDELVSALRAANATVEERGVVKTDDMLKGEKHVLDVDEELVQVWQYRTEQQAQKDSRRIGADGSTVDMSFGSVAIYDWVAPPHFYHKGRIIVLYNGNKTALYESILGQQFSPR